MCRQAFIHTTDLKIKSIWARPTPLGDLLTWQEVSGSDFNHLQVWNQILNWAESKKTENNFFLLFLGNLPTSPESWRRMQNSEHTVFWAFWTIYKGLIQESHAGFQSCLIFRLKLRKFKLQPRRRMEEKLTILSKGQQGFGHNFHHFSKNLPTSVETWEIHGEQEEKVNIVWQCYLFISIMPQEKQSY